MDTYDTLITATDNTVTDVQLTPVCASMLVDQEATTHDRLARLHSINYGCTELDDVVLRGGLQRGSIVGISATDTDCFGLMVRFFLSLFFLIQLLKRVDGSTRHDKIDLG